ncbi:hypothetical protein KSP40_PGU009377 [Platanthera guangdongensis]|uniref:Uncharacterized protein n=1 Tax=Platanthera guangdongensis TaxID=2320717 RepID=A0ABR2LPV8_9ASPA
MCNTPKGVGFRRTDFIEQISGTSNGVRRMWCCMEFDERRTRFDECRTGSTNAGVTKCPSVDIFCTIGRGTSSRIGWITSLEILL